jgi:multidrug efflux system outer membrane protein
MYIESHQLTREGDQPVAPTKVRQAYVVATLSALLASCAVGPNYVQPTPSVPAQWSDAATSSTNVNAVDASAASLSQVDAWWTSFNDPLLSSLIERAATTNLDVRQTVLRIAEARAQRDVSAAGRWPQVSANAAYQRQRFSENTLTGQQLTAAAASGVNVPNPYDQYQLGLDASWEIDLFGRIRHSVEAANADTQAAIEDRHAVLLSLASEVAQSYIELRGAQLSLRITRDAVATQHDLLELTQQRRSAGLTSELDVANAAALLASSEAQAPTLERQITQGINQLSQLLGREPNALRTELEAAQMLNLTPPQVPLGIPAEVARQRPDVRRAEARLHAATARVGVAVAELFPRLSLGASAGWQAQDASNLTDWASRFISFGPQLELPIFSGGQRRATVRLQTIHEQEAALDYERTVLASLHEVENALAAYTAEQSRHESLNIAVARNRDAVELARLRYGSGVASFLEVLDAERTLQQNELQFAQSVTVMTTDLVALYKALGGGWDELDAAANAR